MSYNKNDKNKRARNWTFVVYPDSCPDNWKDILLDLHTNVIISPLHDKDTNPDGTPKKPHYHTLVIFDGNKSYNQVCELTQSLNATVPQICNNTKGMVRYFIHLDNPEKYPYLKENITCFGYVDLEDYFKISYTERYLFLADMLDYIKSNDIREYADFIDYCRTKRLNDWFPLLCDSNCNVIMYYIRSNNYRGNTPK